MKPGCRGLVVITSAQLESTKSQLGFCAGSNPAGGVSEVWVVRISNNCLVGNNPANIYLFKVNNRNTINRCEICSKLAIKTPERGH